MTADTSDYQNIAPFEDFCTSIGDVRQSLTTKTEVVSATVGATGTQETVTVTSLHATPSSQGLTAIQTTVTRNAGRGIRPSGRGGLMGFAIVSVFRCLVLWSCCFSDALVEGY